MYLREKSMVMPSFYKEAPVGDYPLYIFLALQGTVYYIDEFMSVHRLGIGGSWNSKMEESINRREQYREQSINMLKMVDEYTNYIHSDVINKRILNIQFNSMIDQRNFNEIKNSKYKIIYDNLGTRGKIKIYIKQYLPWMIKFWKSIKKRYMS
jgi:hypothetical protein